MATDAIEVVYARAGDAPPSEGKLHVKEFSASDRLRRAIKLLLGMWVIAAVAVLIPIAHWILVPGFLLGGPIAAYWRYRETRAAEKVEVRCPACGSAQTIAVDARAAVPFYVYCPKCNAGLQLTAQ